MTSIEQYPNGALVVMAQPISVVKDPIFLNRLKKAFQEQLRDANTRALQDLQHGEHPFVGPVGPMVPVPQRKAQRKKRRNITTKLLFEVPFSFEIPRFCFEENIDLDIVLLNRFREGGSWGNHVPQFSVAERFQNWLLEKRERNRDNNNGILIKDWFYHHLPSHQTFRSQQEALNFLITGDISKKAKRSDAAGGGSDAAGGEDSDEDVFTVPDVEGAATNGCSSKVNESNLTDPHKHYSGFSGKRRQGKNPLDKEHRRHKRLLRNRVSAQQARERKKVYVNDLESKAVDLEEKNTNLEEQISTLINENTMLRKVLMNTRAKVDDNNEA